MPCRAKPIPPLKLILFALASLGLVGTACQLPPFLPEFQVNTSDPGNNSAEDVAMSDQGEFVVTWGEFTLDSEAFGRGFAASTVPFGGPFPVNANTTPSRKTSSIARDAENRFVIVWSEDDTEIWGQRFASDGTPLGDNFQISLSTTGYVAKPHVASDPSGNFVVTWTSYPPELGSSEAIARRFDSHGAPFGDEFPVSVYTTGFQYPSGIGMSPAGFVVTWFGEGEYGNAVFGRRFDASGAPITGDFQVWLTGEYGVNVRPDVGMNGAGDFVVVWDERIGFSFPAMGRRYNSNGEPAADVFPISDTSLVASDAKVASDSAGNFVVTWSSSPGFGQSGAGDTNDIRARLYDIGGVAVSEEFVVNEITTGPQSRGRPSLADDGSFVVAFNDGVVFDADVKGRKSGARAAPAITVDPSLEVPSAPSGGSNANRVFEPGETVVLHTAWVNDTAADVIAVVGSSPLFTGPAGADYTLDNDGALYDTIPAGQTKSCAESGGECFIVTVSDPAVRPVQHWDARLQETLTLSLPHTWVLHIGESFPDVPADHQFYRFIENLFHNGVTGGCAGGDFCPGNTVTRAQMAVFLLKAKFGSAHIPAPCNGTVFNDVPCSGNAFDPWIEELAGLQITGGCGNGNYCPGNTVTRQQMAVFLLKTFEGSAYVPPTCTGIFDDVACPSQFADWIEELADRAITGGCSVTPALYCPTNPNNRGQMAVFLVKTFGLVLYGG